LWNNRSGHFVSASAQTGGLVGCGASNNLTALPGQWHFSEGIRNRSLAHGADEEQDRLPDVFWERVPGRDNAGEVGGQAQGLDVA
jgi:hypothetical protein